MPGDSQVWADGLGSLAASLTLLAGVVVVSLCATVEWALAAYRAGSDAGFDD